MIGFFWLGDLPLCFVGWEEKTTWRDALHVAYIRCYPYQLQHACIFEFVMTSRIALSHALLNTAVLNACFCDKFVF